MKREEKEEKRKKAIRREGSRKTIEYLDRNKEAVIRGGKTDNDKSGK